MRASKPFHFKHFSLAQTLSTHKVGTDGVLLGAWVKIGNTEKRILDIGTGSAVISLMLAQRTGLVAQIDGVEIDSRDVEQARKNVLHSPWPEKVKIHHAAIQEYFTDEAYDLIVSNPPYFINSWLPPEKRRMQARHTHSLSFEALLLSSFRLLAKHGRIAIILPLNEGMEFIALAASLQLHLNRKTNFRARLHKPVERMLMEFSFENTPVEETELVLYDAGDTWSEDYRLLTRDFYLKS
jgi:tRNA1Val (adenine37-N6)-methyltransferase